jgi:hypothetical protein
MAHNLDVQYYLDAAVDSTKRSRTVAILIVVTCVLVFTGLVNEQKSNWLLSRLNGSRHPEDVYIKEKLGPPPSGWATASAESSSLRYYDYRYKELVGAMTRAYVDSALLLRVPFFGVVVDVNDLGLLGGITFMILLVWYRLSLAREVDNLELYFAEMKGRAEEREFYNLLAMRQVFTVPRTGKRERTKFLLWAPKLICWLPVALHCSVLGYDLGHTPGIANALNRDRFIILIATEAIFAITLVFLAFMASHRLRRIDSIWDDQWSHLNPLGAIGEQSTPDPDRLEKKKVA